MGCSCSQQKVELENEFDQIWGNLKRFDLFKPQQLKKYVNGKVYFQLLFSKFLIHFYGKIQNSIKQLLPFDSDKIVMQLQQEMKKMEFQKLRLQKISEEIMKKYPSIKSYLMADNESMRQEEGEKKIENQRQSNKSTKSNKSKASNKEKQEVMRGSTIKEGEGIDLDEDSGQQTYEMPSSAIDQKERNLEMSDISYVKLEGIERNNDKLEFERGKRILLEERILQLEGQLEKARQDCNRLKKDKQQLEKMEKNSDLNEEMKVQLQGLKNNSLEYTKNIQSLKVQNKRLQLKIIQLQNQSSLKPNKSFSPINSSFPQQQQSDKALRSFIILDSSQEAAQTNSSQNIIRGCEIIFKLFTDSKLLPNHTLFQTAVGVRTIIGEMFGRPIRGSKLLYSYDSINPVSFGKYIENKSNLLTIFKLRNGTLVGGFAGRIDEGGYLQSSFLFSVRSQKEPIKLVTKRRVAKIDREPGMMIFGAGELTIKIRSLELNCNICNMQAVYGSQNKKNVSTSVFLGDSESIQPLEGYQIFQLQFHQIS